MTITNIINTIGFSMLDERIKEDEKDNKKRRDDSIKELNNEENLK